MRKILLPTLIVGIICSAAFAVLASDGCADFDCDTPSLMALLEDDIAETNDLAEAVQDSNDSHCASTRGRLAVWKNFTEDIEIRLNAAEDEKPEGQVIFRRYRVQSNDTVKVFRKFAEQWQNGEPHEVALPFIYEVPPVWEGWSWGWR